VERRALSPPKKSDSPKKSGALRVRRSTNPSTSARSPSPSGSPARPCCSSASSPDACSSCARYAIASTCSPSTIVSRACARRWRAGRSSASPNRPPSARRFEGGAFLYVEETFGDETRTFRRDARELVWSGPFGQTEVSSWLEKILREQTKMPANVARALGRE